MGNASRKVAAGTAAAPEAEEASEVYLDPRSPTPDVTRTPITGADAVKHKITKKSDLTKTLESCDTEEKLIHNNPILTAVIRNHLMYDPRSPTQDFERTPVILAPSNVNNNIMRPHNGSISFDGDGNVRSLDKGETVEALPKNLCEEFDLTLDSTFRDPEPLGSSTASQDAIEVDAALTPKALLETNFDYVPSEPTEHDEIIPKVLDETPDIEDVKNKLKNRFKILKKADPRSPSQGIDRTPIVLPNKVVVSVEDEVEDMSEESLVAALQNGIADFRRTPVNPPDAGLLIYEDDSTDATVLTQRKTKSATKGVRTPLSCMKNKTEERSKSAAMIVDAKKKIVSKIPKRVGSIPRVQSLQKTISVELEKCKQDNELEKYKREHENTPPVSHRDVWDKDSSVVL